MSPELIAGQLKQATQARSRARNERFGPAIAIDEPVSIVSPIVFASPHSGRIYPESFVDMCAADRMDLRRVEDAYVDRILSEVSSTGAPVIRGLIGRAFIDLNRAESEMDRTMFRDAPSHWTGQRSSRVAAGLGCIPRVAHRGVAIYRQKLGVDEARARINHVYKPYHQALEALLRRAQAMFGQCWLVDCHSMPAEGSRPGSDPDIILGDRFGAACDRQFTDFVEGLFQKRGYSTGRNSPYAGGYATMKHGRPARGRHALQIEIRRSLYMDEYEVEPHDGLVRLRQHLSEIAEELCRFTRASAGLAAHAAPAQTGAEAKKKAAP